MTAGSPHLFDPSVPVDGLGRSRNTRGRLECNTNIYLLPGRNAPQHSTRMIRSEARRGDLIAVFSTALFDAGKATADLDTLNRVNRHHGTGYGRVQFIENRLSDSRRHAARNHPYLRTNRITRAPRLIDQCL